MIDNLRAIILFTKTAELGSFRKCARHFNLSPSVVSQQISRLEKKHATTLLYRSTRKLSLTDEGKAFYLKAQEMMESAQQALDTLSQNAAEPTGKITLSMPAGLVKSALMRKIASFALHHPQLKLDIQFTDQRVDMVAEGIDLAFRVGKMNDSSLKSIRLGDIKRSLVCSPQYAALHSLPKQPEDLSDWNWIKMKMMPPYRTLLDQNGQARDIAFQAQIEVDNVEAMVEMTRMGLGLSTPPDFLIKDDLAQGKLIEVLKEWHPAPMTVYAIWPENSVRRHLTHLLLERLTGYLSGK